MASTNTRSLFKIVLIALGILALFAYAIIQARYFLSGPLLEVTEPRNGETVASTSAKVIVRGHAEHISFLTINGLQVFTDEKGDFARALLLSPGLAIITVEAQDKFKRSVTKELQLIVK